MRPKLIKNETDYEAALARVDELFDAKPDTPEGDELELLVKLVELYEEEVYPIGLPDSIEAIKFRMEQGGLKQKELIPYIGSRSKVSEVLSGQRSLSVAMMRRLHDGLGIPAEVLLREPEAKFEEHGVTWEWDRFPVNDMLRRGWFNNVKADDDSPKSLFMSWSTSLGENVRQQAMLRQHVRSGSRADEYALTAWLLHVSKIAEEQDVPDYKPGTINEDFVSEIVHLSCLDNGPKLASEYLRKHGVRFVVEEHLPKTHLDGAAIKLDDDKPLVAMSLRYDRQDYFWFTLCHELAHLALHFDGDYDVFFDDLEAHGENDCEGEADRWAMNVLISEAAWKEADLCSNPSAERVFEFAAEQRIDPVIPMGRIRRETGNYRLFGRYVASKKIRSFFEQN